MKSVLITGANKSIGFEIAKQLAEKGLFIYLGSRDLGNGQEAAAKLKAAGFENVEAVQLDVTDQASVDAARAEIGKKTGTLDILINNAGINGGPLNTKEVATGPGIDSFKKVYDTNIYGAVRVTKAFIDLLKTSPEPRIVNVSSGLGSLTLAADPSSKYYDYKGVVYQSSKAALNMYTIALAYELRDTAFKVNSVDPGFTKTDFNNHKGTSTPEEAATRIIKYALIGQDGPTGQFFSEESNPETGEIPW